MGSLKKIGHWFFSHLLFWILERIGIGIWLGGTAMVISIVGWLVSQIQLFTAYIIFGGGLIVVIVSIFVSMFLSRRPILQILSPEDGNEVGVEHMVRIFSSQPIPFQLLIFSGDNLWHLQKRVPTTKGTLYNINCQFGKKGDARPKNNPTGKHIIQAIVGDKVKESVVENLPKRAIKSKPICVYRKIQSIRIIFPLDKALVPVNLLVGGDISDSNTAVWVIIHPKDSLHYYVYPKINGIQVAKNGTWGTLVSVKWEESPRPSVGRVMMSLDVVRGVNGDVGKHFQIMAVANPEDKLGGVDRLTRWPTAEYESEIIEVIRE